MAQPSSPKHAWSSLANHRDLLRVASVVGRRWPRSLPARPGVVAVTVYQARGIDLDSELRDRQDRPLAMLPEGRPIPGVF